MKLAPFEYNHTNEQAYKHSILEAFSKVRLINDEEG